jgi:hypothetical protein
MIVTSACVFTGGPTVGIIWRGQIRCRCCKTVLLGIKFSEDIEIVAHMYFPYTITTQV